MRSPCCNIQETLQHLQTFNTTQRGATRLNALTYLCNFTTASLPSYRHHHLPIGTASPSLGPTPRFAITSTMRKRGGDARFLSHSPRPFHRGGFLAGLDIVWIGKVHLVVCWESVINFDAGEISLLVCDNQNMRI